MMSTMRTLCCESCCCDGARLDMKVQRDVTAISHCRWLHPLQLFARLARAIRSASIGQRSKTCRNSDVVTSRSASELNLVGNQVVVLVCRRKRAVLSVLCGFSV